MAQVRPKLRWFEQHWRQRLNLATKLLRDFEDAWLRSEQPFPSREVAAVLLNVFAFDFHSADFIGYRGIPAEELWRRSLDHWISLVGPPESECARLSPNRKASEYRDVVESICNKLSRAAESWATRGWAEPACEELVEWLLDALLTGGFVVVKYD